MLAFFFVALSPVCVAVAGDWRPLPTLASLPACLNSPFLYSQTLYPDLQKVRSRYLFYKTKDK